MKAIILCGGFSTRLGEITKTIPKNLLDIKGKTVLERQIEKLKKLGIKKVILAAGHLASELQKFTESNQMGIEIEYVIEKNKLGTGGAIKNAWLQVENKNAPILIYNGDILLTDSLEEFVKNISLESEGKILATKVNNVSTYGTLIFNKDNRLLEFREKTGKKEAGYINGGVYLFTEKIWQLFPEKENFSIEYDVFPKITNLDVYLNQGTWLDIGEKERLIWARKNWLD